MIGPGRLTTVEELRQAVVPGAEIGPELPGSVATVLAMDESPSDAETRDRKDGGLRLRLECTSDTTAALLPRDGSHRLEGVPMAATEPPAGESALGR